VEAASNLSHKKVFLSANPVVNTKTGISGLLLGTGRLKRKLYFMLLYTN